jgi:hypothetical protein
VIELHAVYDEGGRVLFYLDAEGLARDENGVAITLQGLELPDTLYMEGLPCRLLVQFLPFGGEARWLHPKR